MTSPYTPSTDLSTIELTIATLIRVEFMFNLDILQLRLPKDRKREKEKDEHKVYLLYWKLLASSLCKETELWLLCWYTNKRTVSLCVCPHKHGSRSVKVDNGDIARPVKTIRDKPAARGCTTVDGSDYFPTYNTRVWCPPNPPRVCGHHFTGTTIGQGWVLSLVALVPNDCSFSWLYG